MTDDRRIELLGRNWATTQRGEEGGGEGGGGGLAIRSLVISSRSDTRARIRRSNGTNFTRVRVKSREITRISTTIATLRARIRSLRDESDVRHASVKRERILNKDIA